LIHRDAAGHGLKNTRRIREEVVLILANDLAALDASRPELERFFAAHNLDPVVSHRIDVIFEELASNAIRHGFTPGSGQSVRVRLRAGASQVELTFEDDGPPFNPIERAEPQAFRSLKDAALGGLGISLVRKLSTAMRYKRLSPPAASNGEAGVFRPVNRVIVTVARAASG